MSLSDRLARRRYIRQLAEEYHAMGYSEPEILDHIKNDLGPAEITPETLALIIQIIKLIMSLFGK